MLFLGVICLRQYVSHVPSAPFSSSCRPFAVLQKHEFCGLEKVHARRPQFELQQACAGNKEKDYQQADESSDIVVPM